MKAIVNYKYGSPDVLRLEEVEKPTPADDELLIKVHAVSVNRSDWEGLTGKPLYARMGGLRKHVIDYTREDFTSDGNQYDFILDLIAYRSAFDYARALKPNGS